MNLFLVKNNECDWKCANIAILNNKNYHLKNWHLIFLNDIVMLVFKVHPQQKIEA